MKVIKDLVEWIDEELEGAKCYAEKYVYHKAKGNQWSSTFRSMAEDELKHAEDLHRFAVEEIESINTVFTAPAEMQDKWNESHTKYVERSAWIRQMLSM